jgi:hypothetical protein
MKAIAAALVLALSCIAMPASASAVHGVVVRKSVQGVRPVPNLLLTLRSSGNVRSVRVYTDAQGEFWFYDVPRGKYVLELWRNGMDDVRNPRSSEACRIEVTGAEISLARPLHLHTRPLRIPTELRDCSVGLEHLYVNG